MSSLPLFAHAEALASRVELRPYQVEAVEAIRASLRGSDRATLLVLATGLGKTIVFSEVARRVVAKGGRVLVLAHRTELLEQATGKLEALGLDVGLEQAGSRAGRHSVVVASVQTLQRRRLQRWAPDHFALVVVDEAHHTAAKSYRTILDHFAGAKVLGVTATPDRGDSKGLGQIFDAVAYRMEIRAGIDAGWLAPLTAKRVVVEGLDLSAVRTTAGDLNQGDLDLAMRAPEAVSGVAGPLVELASERQVLAFAVTVEHARALAEAVNDLEPGAAVALDGSATPERRSWVLGRYRAGAVRVLVNCALFTEGFDAPETACVAIARPTKSRALYAQMVGRGTRLADGKRDCLILDFAGLAGKHRLVGPADVLAGEPLDDDEQAELDAALGGDEPQDVALAVEGARARARQKREARRIAWSSVDVQLFGDVALEAGYRREWEGQDATADQTDYLEAKGMTTHPYQMDRARAGALVEALRARQKAGLCTYKQARVLARFGVDTGRLGFHDASSLISELAAVRWRPTPAWTQRARDMVAQKDT